MAARVAPTPLTSGRVDRQRTPSGCIEEMRSDDSEMASELLPRRSNFGDWRERPESIEPVVVGLQELERCG